LELVKKYIYAVWTLAYSAVNARFFNVSMQSSESIKDYLGRLMDIHRKLADGGYAFTDRFDLGCYGLRFCYTRAN
jgi:hypothetical protein